MSAPRRIAVVTGTRAEYGLLRTVMRAIDAHPALSLEVIVTGTHLIGPAHTAREVEADFEVAAMIPMQEEGATGRFADAAALGRGVSGLANRFEGVTPDVVLVLGDRIEPFAAASAASAAGIRIAHLHGGDRAEGVADEAWRHAITKLAHIHLPASPQSAERIIAMGELPLHVHLVGSPALDELDHFAPLDDAAYGTYGQPEIVFLFHPTGEPEEVEYAQAKELLAMCAALGRVLALHPNHDPGREGIVRAIEESGVPQRAHLPRSEFIGLLKRARVIVGNSSGGLIECAAINLPCVNIGTRQRGREKPAHVRNVPEWNSASIRVAIERSLIPTKLFTKHRYGTGRAGEKTANVLATFDPAKFPIRKQNVY